MVARSQTSLETLAASYKTCTLRTTNFIKNKSEVVMGMQSGHATGVSGGTMRSPSRPQNAGEQVKYNLSHHGYCKGPQLDYIPAESKCHQRNDSYQRDPADSE